MNLNSVVCSNGQVSDPHLMFNFISLNCVPYTIPELAFFVVGCLMWVVAYAFVLVQAKQFKVIEMAALAGASNLAWEFVWSVPVTTDMGWFLGWTYRAWFIFDLFIFWQLLKLGKDQFTTPSFRKLYGPIVWASTVFFVAFYWTMYLMGLDTTIGAHSAYICQFLISVLCLVLFVQQPSVVGWAWTITWLRSLGTIFVSVFMLMHYTQDYFLWVLCVSSGVLDVTYCVLFLKEKKNQVKPILVS